MKDVLRFPINSPTCIALRFGQGKHVEGRYGHQVMYSLADERVMYVPPVVAQRIEELAIGPGEPFEILRQEVKNGTRKWIEWRVRRAPQQPASSPNNAAAAAEVLTCGGDAPNPNTNGAAQQPPNGHPDGSNGNLPATVSETITGAGIRAMELALNGAAEIAQRVEGRAASRSYSLRFSNEDIRAIGLTLYIQAVREAGARWQS